MNEGRRLAVHLQYDRIPFSILVHLIFDIIAFRLYYCIAASIIFDCITSGIATYYCNCFDIFFARHLQFRK